MIDNKIIALLESDDPEQRKRGIKVLAQSKNPDALPYLAELVRYDEDAEVVELARKAGAFIKKNAGMGTNASAGRSPASSARAAPPPPTTESIYPDDAGDEERELRPEEIYVSERDIQNAKGLVDQALATHMRGDNDKAAQYLTRAFTINPKLRYDSYTVGLAATITGLASDEAVKMLAPSAAELRKRQQRGAGRAGTAATPGILTFLLFIAASVLLVGYLLFPWIDFSSIPTTGLDGQQTTFGEAFQQMKTLLTSTFEGLAGSSNLPPEVRQAMDALNSIKISFTGLETAMIGTGMANVLDVMGFGTIAELSGEPLPEVAPVNPAPLDYTLLLVPVVAVVAAIIGLVLMARGGTVSLWVIVIVFALIGVVPFWYFYTEAREQILNTGANIDLLGELNISSGLNLVAYGFWVSLAAQLAVLFIPFIALILAKPQTEE